MSIRMIREAWPVARIPHTCCWCGQTIQAKTRYKMQYLIADGHHRQHHHWHEECFNAAIRQNLEEPGPFRFNYRDNPRPETQLSPDGQGHSGQGGGTERPGP